MKKIFLFTAILFAFISCNRHTVDPDTDQMQFSATVDDYIFTSPEVEFAIVNNQRLTITARDGNRLIILGTSWPVDPGTYVLNYADPYRSQHFYGLYNYASMDYFTDDHTGEITIHTVRSENNKIVELTASFVFEGFSLTNDHVLVTTGRIRYGE